MAAAAAAVHKRKPKVERKVAVALVDSNYRSQDVTQWDLLTTVDSHKMVQGKAYPMELEAIDNMDMQGPPNWICPVECQRKQIGYVLRISSVHHVRVERLKSPNHGQQKKL